MKILMSCYACDPNRGSEAGVGWNWAVQAASSDEVWVITREKNRGSIEDKLEGKPVPQLQFLYHDLPHWATWWKKRGRGLPLYYFLWQVTALLKAYRAHRLIKFDVVHHVTFNSIDMPGLLWKLPIPFVWGPVGGAQEPPSSLREYFGNSWLKERRRIWRKRALRLNPLVRGAARNSSLILTANADTEMALKKLSNCRIERELETAVELPTLRENTVHEDFIVLWAGQFIKRKAPRLAIDAFAKLQVEHRIKCRMVMVGDGSLRPEMQRIVLERGLDSTIDFPGKISYNEMNHWYSEADAFLFTSLHDTSGNVVLEAMANGLPVVALNHHGAAEILTEHCGIKVPITSPDQVVTDISMALACLAHEPQVATRFGAEGRLRASNTYSWNKKGDRMRQLYREMVSI